MKHLPKEKKQHLLLVVIGTLGVLVGIWFGLISWQQSRLSKLASEVDARRSELADMTDTINQSTTIRLALQEQRKQLEAAEAQMASGDLYEWIISAIRGFKGRHPRVEIPNYSTILVGETTLLPEFPYQQATLTVAGKAYYHDLGRFIADLENEFPYIRVQNLQLEPVGVMDGSDAGRLSFRMDVVALVKPEA